MWSHVRNPLSLNLQHLFCLRVTELATRNFPRLEPYILVDQQQHFQTRCIECGPLIQLYCIEALLDMLRQSVHHGVCLLIRHHLRVEDGVHYHDCVIL